MNNDSLREHEIREKVLRLLPPMSHLLLRRSVHQDTWTGILEYSRHPSGPVGEARGHHEQTPMGSLP